MTKIFIGTPTTNGIVSGETYVSTLRMVGSLERGGVQTSVRVIDGAIVSRARDIIAHDFLRSDCTHLLAIDSDMLFPPDLCERMLAFDKPVIGAVYPSRYLDLERVRALADNGHTFDSAVACGLEFNVAFEGPQVQVTNGLCRVNGVGFGFMLIRRECFTRLLDEARLPEVAVRQRDRGGLAKLRSFFSELEGTPEDYSFCDRWRSVGGEVWVYADAEVRHIGDFQYGMALSEYLRLRLSARLPA